MAFDGVLSVSDSFTLTVTPVNDAPALSGTLADIYIAEDGTVDFTLPDGIFTDVDGDPLALSAALSDGSALPGWLSFDGGRFTGRSEEHTSELQSLMRISYAVFCLKNKHHSTDNRRAYT